MSTDTRPADRLNLLARLCSLERRSGELPDMGEAEARSLAAAANEQGVAGWLLHRLTESYADWSAAATLAPLLRPYALRVVAHNAHALGVVREIESLLSDMPTIRLKGTNLIESPYYADISHRTAGDIDLWVQPDRIYEARERLLAAGAGYTDGSNEPIESDTNAHFNAIDFHGVIVELHRRLLRKDFNWDLPGSLADYAVEEGGRLTLRPDALLYSLVLHAYKHHVWQQVVNLKWVVDMAKVLNSTDDMETLLRLLRRTSADSAKAMRWAVGLAMPLLPQSGESEMREMGFEPLDFAGQMGAGGVGVAKFKLSALELVVSGVVTRVRHAKGLKGKMSALANSIRYEADRTRRRYPSDSLAVGIIKRIFKKA